MTTAYNEDIESYSAPKLTSADLKRMQVFFGVELEMHIGVCKKIWDKLQSLDQQEKLFEMCFAGKYISKYTKKINYKKIAWSNDITGWHYEYDGSVEYESSDYYYDTINNHREVQIPKDYIVVDGIELVSPKFNAHSVDSFVEIRDVMKYYIPCPAEICNDNRGVFVFHSSETSTHVHVSFMLGELNMFKYYKNIAKLHAAWLKFQDYFYEMVPCFRHLNEYCMPHNNLSILSCDRYYGLNYRNLFKTGTLEFRIKHGSNDPEELIGFIQLYICFCTEVLLRTYDEVENHKGDLVTFLKQSAKILRYDSLLEFINTQTKRVQRFNHWYTKMTNKEPLHFNLDSKRASLASPDIPMYVPHNESHTLNRSIRSRSSRSANDASILPTPSRSRGSQRAS